ncbi:MAG: tetraacyldisaccharide 4'-kinase, partial [Thermoanaerobaculia bacterium]
FLPAGAAVVAVAGIARPHRFLDAARAHGLEVRRELLFGDHHHYPEPSLRRIEQTAREAGAAWVLTTAKDFVKLYGRLDFPLARLAVRAEPEPALFAWLDERIDALMAGRPSARTRPREQGPRGPARSDGPATTARSES